MTANPATSLRFHGVYASTVCPMQTNGAVDETELSHHLSLVLGERGLRGLLVNGHAGENAVLTRTEQRRVVEIARGIGRDRLIVAGVNAESSDFAAQLAKDAAEAGTDAIMVFPPFSWALGADPRVILRHHETVHEAVSLPIFLFQGSVRAGQIAFTPDVLTALLRLPRIVAIKEGSWETAAYEAVRRLVKSLRPDIAVMASGDEHLFTCFVLGSEGSLVSLAAIIPELIVALDTAVTNGNLTDARALHEKIYPVAKAIYGTPPGSLATARIKACLKLLGRIKSATCRAPVDDLPNEEFKRLEIALSTARLAMEKVSDAGLSRRIKDSLTA
jgi:4-hydroxy-tetrahydrodipicolinate synthase